MNFQGEDQASEKQLLRQSLGKFFKFLHRAQKGEDQASEKQLLRQSLGKKKLVPKFFKFLHRAQKGGCHVLQALLAGMITRELVSGGSTSLLRITFSPLSSNLVPKVNALQSML